MNLREFAHLMIDLDNTDYDYRFFSGIYAYLDDDVYVFLAIYFDSKKKFEVACKLNERRIHLDEKSKYLDALIVREKDIINLLMGF